jgi:hypothetical protein
MNLLRIVINGIGITGVELLVAKAIIKAKCDLCGHTTLTHVDNKCMIQGCVCRKPFTSYLLLQDENFIQFIKDEGVF